MAVVVDCWELARDAVSSSRYSRDSWQVLAVVTAVFLLILACYALVPALLFAAGAHLVSGGAVAFSLKTVIGFSLISIALAWVS